jgi:hypothetical protein
MKITLDIKNLDNIGDVSQLDIKKFSDIFSILVEKGALTGVRGGCAKLHFDGDGNFMGVELDYWPYRKRKDR